MDHERRKGRESERGRGDEQTKGVSCGPRDQSQANQSRGCVAKMAELYRDPKLEEGKPSPGLERFRVGVRVSSVSE